MSVPATFKAALVTEQGAKNAIVERSLSPLAPGEVAIKITATAINPVDWKIRDLGWFVDSFPTVLGSDAAGEIAAVGPDVTNFSVGDRVNFQGIIGNLDASTFQRYARIPAHLVSKTPDNISDDEAAGVQVAFMAALVGLYEKSGFGLPAPWDVELGGSSAGRGRALVVIGGASSLGQYAIQLARLSGYDRIITNASPRHRDWLTRLGAHVVLDRSTATTADFVAALDGKPLDFVFDTISSKDTEILGVDILRAAGVTDAKLVVVLPPAEEAKAASQSQEPKVEISHVIAIGSLPHLRYLVEPAVKILGEEDGWLATGKIVPNRVTIVEGGLSSVDAALEKNKIGVSGEKIIIRPWE